MSAWHSSEITHTSRAGFGSRIRERTEETKARRERQGLAVVSVGGLQHRFTQRKVPVVLSPMLFEMLPSHVLCRALFELHLPKAPVFGCTLGKRQNF